MYNECKAMLDLLQDPKRTALNLITLTEEMPVNETIELKKALDEDLDIPLGYLIANCIYPRLFSAHEAAGMASLVQAAPARSELTTGLLRAGLFRHERCHLQAKYLDRLKRKTELPIIEVPYYFIESLDFDVVSRIAEHIEECVER